jgi:hypothetical protein
LSSLTPYLALAAFPIAFLLGFALNPIEFSWAFHHGLEPMPEEVRDRAAAISRYVNFLGDALILGFVVVLALRNSIVAARVGLHLDKWKTNIALGIAGGVLLIVLQGLMVKSIPRGTSSPFACRVRRGSVLLWVFIFIAGAFSEELWIAFCLVALTTTGHSVPLSAAITVAVFAAVHYGYRLGGAVAVALKGVVSVLLFLWFGSLIPMFLFHCIGNLGSLYWARCTFLGRSDGAV